MLSQKNRHSYFLQKYPLIYRDENPLETEAGLPYRRRETLESWVTYNLKISV